MEFKQTDYKEEKDYWFNRIEEHGDDVFDYGEDYYMIRTLRLLIPVLKIPQAGKVCMLRTHTCHSFLILEKHFGEER